MYWAPERGDDGDDGGGGGGGGGDGDFGKRTTCPKVTIHCTCHEIRAPRRL